MTFMPDITADALLVDGVETVQLYADTVVSVARAERGLLTLADTEFRQLGLEPTDLAWNLPGESLGGVEPSQGQAIEDASGVFWTILSVAHAPLTDVWRTITRRQLRTPS